MTPTARKYRTPITARAIVVGSAVSIITLLSS
jgi:hypothetical protein